MPAGAEPLAAYARRYGGAIEDGRRVIWGSFALRGLMPNDAAIEIFDHMPPPLWEDGGCSIVTLKFDVPSKRIVWIACNGEA